MSGGVILGGGLAGLGCASIHPDAKIFEALAHAGGHVFSHEHEGIYFDEGAHICHAKDQAWLDLLYQQAGTVVQIPQSKVANYWHGNWVTYPVQNHLNELPLDSKTAALTDFVSAQIQYKDFEPTHYLEWCRSQYGDFLTDRFYKEYTQKYWRVPMEELGLDWLSGRLLPSQVQRIVAGALAPQDERQSVFSRFHYPEQGGFYGFFKPLFDSLDITCNARANRIDPVRNKVEFSNGLTEEYEWLASSIPLPDLVFMIDEAPEGVKQAASLLRYLKLLCVNIIVDDVLPLDHHWFYIYDESVETARVSVLNNLSPASVPAGKTALQAEIFRRGDEIFDTEYLVSNTLESLSSILKTNLKQGRCTVQPVEVSHAYVISDLQRASAVETITNWLTQKKIYPMGLFGTWKFIWSDAAYQSGVGTGKVLKELQT